MARRPASPTLQDVARRAGVHPATVSRALARPELVAAATRERVLAAVDELGFVPNRHAQRLAGGGAEAVGVVVPDVANPYFATLLRAVQAEAADRDLEVLLADSNGDPATEARILRALSHRVDGLVVATPVSDLSEAEVPVVQVNRQSRGIPSVVVDQRAIVALALGHLTDLGHRHVAMVTGPSRYWSARQRARALKARAGDRVGAGPHGLEVTTVQARAGTFEAGRDAIDAVLTTGATAAVTFNDVQAAGLLVGAHEAGVEVPGDLSVVGSDGLELAAMTMPTLTTVAAPHDAIGRRALARLMDDAGPSQTVLEPHLSIGGSTGRPRRISTSTHEFRRPHADVS